MFTTPLLLLASAALAAAAPSCSAPAPRRSAPELPRTGADEQKLPAPPAGFGLAWIALGFGYQNYTCASHEQQASATGALAMLYDITHLYPGQGPDSLSHGAFANLTTKVLSSGHSVPIGLDGAVEARHHQHAASGNPFPRDAPLTVHDTPTMPFLGHHFFDAAGVPTFVLGPGPVRLPTAKVSAVNPPKGAYAGPDGTGAVGWLYLKTKGDVAGHVYYVYRVLTAGGVSHGCGRSLGDDSTSYTATYWFYRESAKHSSAP